MVTKQALSEIGIKSQDKSTDPNWPFLIGCFITMNFFLYGIIAMIFCGYNLNMKKAEMLASDNEKHNIYYDKVKELDNTENEYYCAGLCKKKVKTGQTKIFTKGLANLLKGSVGPKDSHKYAMGYKDLENLKDRFDEATIVLRRQMKDREKHEARMHPEHDEMGDLIPYITEDTKMVEDFSKLKDFCVESRKVIKDHVKDKEYQDAIAEQERIEAE